MKKLTTLLLAAGLVFAASAPASAVDIKMDGTYEIQFTQGKNKDFVKDGSKFDRAHQRVRLGLTTAVSENLSARFQTETKWDWGNNSYAGTFANDGSTAFDGAKVETFMRAAYIDWTVPGTAVKVRMGRHDIALPALAVGKNTAIWWQAPTDGITVAAPITDWASLTAFWARYNRVNGTDTAVSDELDMFGAIADLKFDGFKVSPFVAFAAVGDDLALLSANNNAATALVGESNAYWAGFASTISMFNPLTIKFDAIYGARDFKSSVDQKDAEGWFVDASVAYKTAYGTPALTAWYATGDDKNEEAGEGYMPSIGGRNAVSQAFFNGFKSIDSEFENNHNLQGTWGVKAAMSGISFLEGLSHEVAVIYAQGTNDKDSLGSKANPVRYMTEEDSMVELNFTTEYKIYKNLTVLLELAYAMEDFDTNLDGRAAEYDDLWRGVLQFTYKF